MKIRTLIVDDMRLARERLNDCLIARPDIEVVGKCKNGLDAVRFIQNHQPDLVFLDVQMPIMGGFEVVEKIGIEKMPKVIFVTAHDEFALRAFEVNAIDYLLKPFDEERLEKALERIRREFEKSDGKDDLDKRLSKFLDQIRSANENKYIKLIAVKSSAYITVVQVEDVEWITAAGNYVEVHTGKETHLIRESMSMLEKKLDPDIFTRIHRSVIVKVNCVKKLSPLFNGDYVVILKNGIKLNMSRNYSGKLLSLLS